MLVGASSMSDAALRGPILTFLALRLLLVADCLVENMINWIRRRGKFLETHAVQRMKFIMKLDRV